MYQLTSNSCSSDTSSGKSVPNDTIPASSHAFFLLRTYVSESLRPPTSTTASPGTCRDQAISVANTINVTKHFESHETIHRQAAKICTLSVMKSPQWNRKNQQIYSWFLSCILQRSWIGKIMGANYTRIFPIHHQTENQLWVMSIRSRVWPHQLD